MDRRDFLKLASCTGLSVVAPTAFGGRELSGGSRASYAPYTGIFSVNFNAGGGWDPTSFCDPKGATSETDPNPMNASYLAAEIEEIGNIKYAPLPYASLFNDTAQQLGLTYSMKTFFEKYYQRLCVVNGIDVQSNGHDTGSRNIWSGRLAEGHPTLAAFAAGAFGKEQPMAFISFGGYAETSGIAPRVRAAGNAVNVLARLAYPQRIDPNTETSGFHSDKVQTMIDAAQAGRDQGLAAKQGLPKIRAAINAMFTARTGSNELRRLQEYLPETLEQGLRGQAQLVLAAYRAGICISANLDIGGFDTHGDHDASHIPQLLSMLDGVDFFMEEAERQGVADKVLVSMGSDFGRTPFYNNGMGKDHWSITSMMFMGVGIPGNRVIGGTDPQHGAYGLSPTGQVDTSPTARHIHPADIHQGLRKIMGLENSDLAAMFPLEFEGDAPLNLFG